MRVRDYIGGWLIVTVSSCIVSSVPAAEWAGWKAGLGQITITPRESMWMAGYGSRDHPAEGKLTDLHAKALVLADAAGNRAVLVTVDLIGIDRELMQRICKKLAVRYQLQREQITLCASHTHTGPALAGNLSPLHYLIVDAEQQERITNFTTQLEQDIVAVVGKALDDLTPVQLSWGSGTADFAVNRRNNRPESSIPELRSRGQLQGPVDHDVPVLAVRGTNGELRAVIFGYACHATVLSFYQWSGDYPGFAQIEIENRHPGCQAMFWAGCGADQNPLPRRSVALAQEYGRQLAGAVDDVLSKSMAPVSSRLRTEYREIELPFTELPTRVQIENDARSDDRFVSARAKLLLNQIEQAGQLASSYPYPIQTWQLGKEIQLAILGGEVVVDFALRLKSELRSERTWVAGYANDVMAYIASRRVLAEGGYEGATAMVYYGLPTAWAPECEDLIIGEVHRQLEP